MAVSTRHRGRVGMSTSEKITVLNPMGFAPKVVNKPLAPRLSTLDGKTVYLVDCRFDDSDVFLKQVQAWFGEHMPSVRTVFKPISSVYLKDDRSAVRSSHRRDAHRQVRPRGPFSGRGERYGRAQAGVRPAAGHGQVPSGAARLRRWPGPAHRTAGHARGHRGPYHAPRRPGHRHRGIRPFDTAAGRTRHRGE